MDKNLDRHAFKKKKKVTVGSRTLLGHKNVKGFFDYTVNVR